MTVMHVPVPGGDYIVCRTMEEFAFATQRIIDFEERYNPELADWVLIANMISLEITRNRIDAEPMANTEQHRQKSSIIEQIRRIQVSLGITREQEIKRTQSKTGQETLQELIELHAQYKKEHEDEYTMYCPHCEAIILVNRRNNTLHKSKLEDFENGIEPSQDPVNIIFETDMVVSERDYERQIIQNAWDIIDETDGQ